MGVNTLQPAAGSITAQPAQLSGLPARQALNPVCFVKQWPSPRLPSGRTPQFNPCLQMAVPANPGSTRTYNLIDKEHACHTKKQPIPERERAVGFILNSYPKLFGYYLELNINRNILVKLNGCIIGTHLLNQVLFDGDLLAFDIKTKLLE